MDTPNAQLRRNKPSSPPWKKIEAEGPTTLFENGRRKSGRIHSMVPLPEPPLPHPDKKRVPHSGSHSNSIQPSPISKRLAAPKPPPRPKAQPTRVSMRKAASPPRETPRRPVGTRRSARQAAKSPTKNISSPRIRLRLAGATIPITHPEIIPKPKTAPSFKDYWIKADTIPVEEGGLYAAEDGPEFTDEMAEKEAQTWMRIKRESQKGGILSEGRCSAFVPEPQEEPPRQWAHADHLLKAMANFRRLMLAEQQRHRQTAKRLAEACRDEWIRRQPKTIEQLEAEAKGISMSQYKIVMKALVSMWENVRTEINRRRLEEWKMQEEKRVKEALNKAVNISEQKLQARRAQPGDSDEEIAIDEEMETDVDEDSEHVFTALSDEDGDNPDEHRLSSDLSEDKDEVAGHDSDESNMSSSSEEEDKGIASDEELTQEQLLKKYANLPELELKDKQTKDVKDDYPREETKDDKILAGTKEDEHTNINDETSDESVDMDDDLGSSDMSDDEDEDEAEEKEESDDEVPGLLGLLFGKQELQRIKQETIGNGESEGEKQEKLETLTNSSELTPSPVDDEDVDMVDVSSLAVDNGGFDEQKHDNANIVSAGRQVEQPTTNGADSPRSGNDAVAADASAAAPGLELFPPKSDVGKTVTPLPTAKKIPNGDSHNSTLLNEDSTKLEALHANGVPNKEALHKNDINPSVAGSSSKINGWKPNATGNSCEDEKARRSTEEDFVSLEMRPSIEGKPIGQDKNANIGEDEVGSTCSPTGPKTEIPFLLRGTLREYQHFGLDWLAGLYADKTNGILADEMGLGKTIQTIALLAHLACHHEVWGPHLVIVPTSVMLNWEMEFKKWCPGFKILSYYGSIEERKRKRQGWTNDDVWNVCITSYQLVLADQQVFKRRRWHYMILDEAHNIKNFKSQRWQTLLGFNTRSRLLLTGTPLQNNLTELWSLLFFLMPPENGQGGFADLDEFQDWFRRPESQILESGRDHMDEEAKAIIQKLHKVLRPYLLRRLKADVEKQLPAKYEHVEFCRLSKRQRELYDGFLARTDTRETLASGNYMSIINCLMQLRKVCNHPDLFVDRPIHTSFRMLKSVPAEYESTTCRLVGRVCGQDLSESISLEFMNLVPVKYEHMPAHIAKRIAQLGSNELFHELFRAQQARADSARLEYDPSTVLSNIAFIENTGRWKRLEELRHCIYVNAHRREQQPIYGKGLVERLTIGIHEFPRKPRPKVPRHIMAWFENESLSLHSMVQTIEQRADAFNMIIQKFSCVTPAVVTRDMTQVLLGRKGCNAFTELDLKLSAPIRYAPFIPPEPPVDPWHEARMRLSIQFPDKRLLQFDCGKLQVLDRLLRKLQAGGHRALIFTQMTKVLDILEQFLNIHGHKYLRLDGATKIEQRQILTDRFNHDPRILCFILSTRSGGLGINLTGADTVIFYDQDWNPAMDKQCQDRCHRIGQTRDVHIYRLVSEHTIEANILRKASQKQMLDDVVIQEGEFTTDYFNKLSVSDVIGEAGEEGLLGNMAANEAMDRLLGQSDHPRSMGKVLEQAEDREDIQAARVAEKEIRADDADFRDKQLPSSGAQTRDASVTYDQASENIIPGASDTRHPSEEEEGKEIEYNAWGHKMGNIDDYMLKYMTRALEGTPLELPKDSNKKKRRRDRRKR